MSKRPNPLSTRPVASPAVESVPSLSIDDLPEPEPEPCEAAAETQVATIAPPGEPPHKCCGQPKEDKIPPHRRCPICWGGRRGVGVVYSSDAGKRYYKCVRTLTGLAPCGHTWTAFVRLEIVRTEHRIITLDGTR